MTYLDKNGLQAVTNKLVQGEAIKVVSHRGHTVKNVIDSITRECKNISTPNTMNLENRINEFKIGKGRDVDVSEDVEEGKVEVELKGKTWQNLVKNYWTMGKVEVDDKYITASPSYGQYIGMGGGFVYNLKQGVQYTFIVNVIENTLEDSFEFTLTQDDSWKNGLTIKGGQTGTIVRKITANADAISGYKIQTSNKNHSGTLKFEKNFLLLEGDYTQTSIEELPKYFEGIKNSFEDGIVDIKVTGKNLFDGQLRTFNTNDTYIDNIGQHHNGDNNIPIKPNTSYTMTFETISGDSHIYIWNGNEKVLTIPGSKDTVSFRTPLECNSLSFYRNVADYTKDRLKYKIQLEENSKSTPYEPYYKKKISFNIREPLRSLPNGVCDEIRNNNGQWELVRRVHKVVLDGSEIWTRYERWDTTNTIQFYLNYSTGLPNTLLEYSAGYCDRFAYKSYSEFNNKQDREGFIIYGGYKNDTNILKTFSPQISISKSKLSTLDVNGFKQWLSQNPTTFYYQLETPTITPIEPMEFDVKPLATMTINSEIAPISNHKVVLNRAGQIEQGIVQIAELKKRVDSLETTYDSYLLETQHKLSLLGFEYQLESEEI